MKTSLTEENLLNEFLAKPSTELLEKLIKVKSLQQHILKLKTPLIYLELCLKKQKPTEETINFLQNQVPHHIAINLLLSTTKPNLATFNLILKKLKTNKNLKQLLTGLNCLNLFFLDLQKIFTKNNNKDDEIITDYIKLLLNCFLNKFYISSDYKRTNSRSESETDISASDVDLNFNIAGTKQVGRDVRLRRICLKSFFNLLKFNFKLCWFECADKFLMFNPGFYNLFELIQKKQQDVQVREDTIKLLSMLLEYSKPYLMVAEQSSLKKINSTASFTSLSEKTSNLIENVTKQLLNMSKSGMQTEFFECIGWLLKNSPWKRLKDSRGEVFDFCIQILEKNAGDTKVKIECLKLLTCLCESEYTGFQSTTKFEDSESIIQRYLIIFELKIFGRNIEELNEELFSVELKLFIQLFEFFSVYSAIVGLTNEEFFILWDFLKLKVFKFNNALANNLKNDEIILEGLSFLRKFTVTCFRHFDEQVRNFQFWDEFLDNVLQNILICAENPNLDDTKSVNLKIKQKSLCIEILSNLKNENFVHLKIKRVKFLLSFLLTLLEKTSYTSTKIVDGKEINIFEEKSQELISSSIGTIGVFINYEFFRSYPLFYLDLISSFKDLSTNENLHVRIRSSWTLANLCVSLASIKEDGFDLVEFGINKDSFAELLECAISASKDNEKCKCNGVRALGNLCRFNLFDNDKEKFLLVIDLILKNVETGLVKTRWNSCHSLSIILTKTSYPEETIPKIICTIFKSVKTKNSKLKIQLSNLILILLKFDHYFDLKLAKEKFVLFYESFLMEDSFGEFSYRELFFKSFKETFLNFSKLINDLENKEKVNGLDLKTDIEFDKMVKEFEEKLGLE
ncbi:HEAT repeat-containing protein 6 [Lobulomyces angularis]|nr:HEAT repeat-containing protein 6 [Lobulomyces angularis]